MVSRMRKKCSPSDASRIFDRPRRASASIGSNRTLYPALRNASVVALYLLPDLNVKLMPQLAKLKPGARIVSHQFPIGRWPPDQTMRGADNTDLYLWTIK